MQKHKQWLDNRTYEQHLTSLLKIKQNFRKNYVKSATHAHHTRKRRISNFYEEQQRYDEQMPIHLQEKQNINKRRDKENIGHTHNHSYSNNHSINNPNMHSQTNCKTFRSTKPPTHSQTNLIKQKQLIWNNFLLGKRIMQTSPVISQKKHQQQYKKHKKIIEWRTQHTKKQAINTQFRDIKLKQFTQSTNRLSNCFRVNNGKMKSKYILQLRVLKIGFYKPHHCLEDVIIKMRSQGKKSVQCSEIVNVCVLPFYWVYFRYRGEVGRNTDGSTVYMAAYNLNNNKNMNCNNSNREQSNILIDLLQAKGLEQRHVGGITIKKQEIKVYENIIQKQKQECSQNQNKNIMVCEFKKSGKSIGELEIQVCVLRRKNFKQTL